MIERIIPLFRPLGSMIEGIIPLRTRKPVKILLDAVP
jgi:hypothetical protein